jgi:excisionase family DNA binding protein
MSNASLDNAMSNGQFCGTSEAARILGLSVGTVQSLVERQELMAWKTQGGHRRIAMTSVQEYQRRNHAVAIGETNPARILWIQESGPLRQKLLQSLPKWGVTLPIEWHENMFEASMGLSAARPGLIVVDLKSQPNDALQFVRMVHQHPDFRQSTVLAFSLQRLPDDVLGGGQGAPVHGCRKPIDWSWLRGYLEAYQLMQMRHTVH